MSQSRESRTMKPEGISASLEDYLETIAELIQTHGHAHAKSIAEKRKVKMPSVTSALGALAKAGHIRYQPNFPVKLTSSGEKMAEQVAWRHQVLEEFLREVLMLSRKEAEKYACIMEHVVSGRLAARLGILRDAICHRYGCGELREHLFRLFQSEIN